MPVPYHYLNANNERQLATLAEMSDIPAQDVATGPFMRDSGETSWWNAFQPVGGTNWSVVETGDTANKEGNWFPIGTPQTAPNRVTDMAVIFDAGNHYRLQRRCREFYWIDWQLMVNGVARFTRSYRWYWYQDERTGTDIEAIQTELEPMGSKTETVTGIAANASLQVQVRQRYRVANSQTSAYFRIIGGLRSQANCIEIPRNLVIGRT